MEREALKKAMKRSISEVLEKMFFLPVDFADTGLKEELWSPETTDKILVARLNFNGPLSGLCHFMIPEDLTRSLTAGFMGEREESVNDVQITETVKEITNMLVGNTFSKFDNQKMFDLGIPEMVDFRSVEKGHSGSGDEIFIAIQTIDSRLAFQMSFN